MMRHVLAAVALLAACGKDSPDYPVGGGTTIDSGMTPSTDAPGGGDAPLGDAANIDGPPPATVDAARIMGRVCLANDPRRLHTCASTGAGGLTVRLGSNATTTNPDGTFSIDAASGTWRVTGPNIVTSIMNLSDYEIPAITRASYDAMVNGSLPMNPGMLNPGEGSVMVQVIHDGVGQVDAVGSSTPSSQFSPRYDTASSASVWQVDATEAGGVIWLPGIDVGTATIRVQMVGATTGITVTGVPIVDGAMTYTTVIFP